MPRTRSSSTKSKSTAPSKSAAKKTATKPAAKKKPVVNKEISTPKSKTTAKKKTSSVAKKADSKSIPTIEKKVVKKKKVSSKEIAKKIDKNIEPHALNDEITEKVRELIHLSREQGFLTYKDIDKSLPEIANDPEELQNVISIFNNLEIKLLDSNEVEKFKQKKECTSCEG